MDNIRWIHLDHFQYVLTCMDTFKGRPNKDQRQHVQHWKPYINIIHLPLYNIKAGIMNVLFWFLLLGRT